MLEYNANTGENTADFIIIMWFIIAALVAFTTQVLN